MADHKNQKVCRLKSTCKKYFHSSTRYLYSYIRSYHLRNEMIIIWQPYRMTKQKKRTGDRSNMAAMQSFMTRERKKSLFMRIIFIRIIKGKYFYLLLGEILACENDLNYYSLLCTKYFANLQGSHLCRAHLFQHLVNAISKGANEIFSQQSKLHVQIVFRVIVAAIYLISSKENRSLNVDVLYLGDDAHLTKVIRWSLVIEESS